MAAGQLLVGRCWGRRTYVGQESRCADENCTQVLRSSYMSSLVNQKSTRCQSSGGVLNVYTSNECRNPHAEAPTQYRESSTQSLSVRNHQNTLCIPGHKQSAVCLNTCCLIDFIVPRMQGEVVYWFQKAAAQYVATMLRVLVPRHQKILCDVWVSFLKSSLSMLSVCALSCF